jgi:hypothetical protein
MAFYLHVVSEPVEPADLWDPVKSVLGHRGTRAKFSSSVKFKLNQVCEGYGLSWFVELL